MKKYLLPVLILILILSLNACRRSQASTPKSGLPSPNVTGLPSEEGSIASADQSNVTPTLVEPFNQTAGSFLAINEIGLGPGGYVSLTNFTSVPVSTKGLYLCQGRECAALPETVIEAGATGRVAVDEGKGLENVITKNAAVDELKPSDGEVALFASDQFDDPKALLAYLQWGSTPHALTDLAVDAGLWIKTAYAPTSEKATRLYRVEESGLWLFEEAKP